MRRILLSLCVFLLLPVSALLAESAVETLERGETSLAAEVVDGDTLLLENGTKVRLVGIQAPKLPLGRAGFEAWPLAEEAKQALEDLALGQTLTLYYGGRKTDRYGRALAHLKREDGLWLQGALLVAGMARVYSFRDNRRLIAEMLAEERDARAARRGIWAHPYYAVRTPEAVADDVGSFQLVEGRVMDSAIVRRRGYVNFGANWKSDFTISIAPRDRKLFGPEGEDILALKGRIVRVRGWIKSFNGAMIEATHPEQIEVFE
ncbi:MAG TPA: thermonuclease family protein [Alphaproteobacteria bacterium]|nr:thermonuclease family protein [Alphaproteobacteria bacterium]